MPKPMFVWSGTQWVSVASEVESLANFATQSYADAQPGSKLIVPTSIAVGSGSGSISTQGAVTFTSASSISLNGCFSSTYDNYRLIWNVTSQTNSTGLVLRVRASGTDLSSSTYSYGHFINAYTTSISGDGSGSATGPVIGYSGSQNTRGIVDILNPQSTLNTYGYYWSGSETSTFNGGFRVNNTTSYDGFTFFPQAGTFTGTLRVYGYKN